MARPVTRVNEIVKRCICGNRLSYGKTICDTCQRKRRNNSETPIEIITTNDRADIDTRENVAWMYDTLSELVKSRVSDSDIVSWAERAITLPPGDGWRGNQKLDFSKYPLAALILRLWKNPSTERLICIQGTQTGKSTIEQVVLIDAMLRSGGNCIFVCPTDSLREKMPRTKIIPILENSVECGYSKAEQGNTILRWKNGRFVWMGLATSAHTLADTSACSTAINTEADECPAGLKHDPISLSFDRIRYHHRRKQFINGTPRRLDPSGLYGMYSSAKMYIAEFPCPHCGDFFGVEDTDLRWPDGVDSKEIKRQKLAYVVCKKCGSEINDSYHTKMAEGATLRCITPDRSDLHVGVRVPSWFSVKLSFSEAVFELIEARNDLTKLSDWYKSIAAKPVDVYKLNAIDDNFRYEQRQSHGWKRENNEIPPDIIAITAGVDVGTRGFWFTLLGWGVNGRKYMIWNGDYSPRGMDKKAWDEAWDKVLDRCDISKYTWLGSGPMPPFKLGIVDSGYDAQAIYELCQRPTRYRWLPAKGDGGAHSLYKKTSADPERKHGQKFAGLPLILHNTHHLQDILEKSLHTPINDNGGIAFPADEQQRMFRHLEAAAKKELPSGASTWEKTSKGAADHLRDALCLAVLAGEIMGLNKVTHTQKTNNGIGMTKEKNASMARKNIVRTSERC